MLENINQIQVIADGINTQPAAAIISDFTNALTGLENHITDPAIFDLLVRIYDLLVQLNTISN